MKSPTGQRLVPLGKGTSWTEDGGLRPNNPDSYQLGKEKYHWAKKSPTG